MGTGSLCHWEGARLSCGKGLRQWSCRQWTGTTIQWGSWVPGSSDKVGGRALGRTTWVAACQRPTKEQNRDPSVACLLLALELFQRKYKELRTDNKKCMQMVNPFSTKLLLCFNGIHELICEDLGNKAGDLSPSWPPGLGTP